MSVSLGSASFDEVITIKQLKIDFKDDWFPDPLGYEDFISAELLRKIVEDNYAENHGTYVPSKALLLNVPKNNFTLRYALETSFSDRAIYQSFAMKLLPFYDPLISQWVFSHRYNSHQLSDRSDEKYVFRNSIKAWSDFIGCVQSALEPGTTLLSTDLANYFENINLIKLKENMIELVPSIDATVEEKGNIRQVVESLFGYLKYWSFADDRGLPQNRDASSFLANVYMRSVDEVMLGKGYVYFRYMDDVKIICPSEANARKALKDLILALRPLGQVVNGGKTRIVSSDDQASVKDCLDAASTEMKRIDSAWASKALNPITRSFLPLKNLALKVLQSGQYNSREFRFCINRFESLARCVEFEVPKAYFADITPLIIDGLHKSPVSTDQICRYLRAVALEDEDLGRLSFHVIDDANCLYNWKNYRIWMLLTQKQHASDELLSHARKIVGSRSDDPTRAGATVYLGAFGGLEDRELIASEFGTLESFLGQRSAMIGVQELHFRPASGRNISIDSHVRPFLRRDLMGVYRSLNRSGVYSEKLEPVSISRYVEFERDYD